MLPLCSTALALCLGAFLSATPSSAAVLRLGVVTTTEPGFAATTVTPVVSEMEKFMGKKAFAEILGSLVEKPKGRPTLVPVSDRRPAITTMDAAQEFTEITEV